MCYIVFYCQLHTYQMFSSLTFYMLCNAFYFSSLPVFWCSSSCSTSHCGSWTCWSGSSPVWFCTSYTLCCALSAGTTLSLWALFSSATTMSFLNCSETALCWAKPTPTPCPPIVWGLSRSKGSAQQDLTFELWMWREDGWRSGKVEAQPVVQRSHLEVKRQTMMCFDTVLFLMQCLYIPI